MDVLVYGMKPFDTEILEDVEQADVDRWVSAKVIVHGDVVRPMCNVLRLQTNYVAPPAEEPQR